MLQDSYTLDILLGWEMHHLPHPEISLWVLSLKQGQILFSATARGQQQTQLLQAVLGKHVTSSLLAGVRSSTNDPTSHPQLQFCSQNTARGTMRGLRKLYTKFI